MLDKEVLEKIIKYRRELHQIPELDDDLPKTRDYVVEKLKKLNCKIIPLLESGVGAYFHKGSEETVAFRSDMDALPVGEMGEEAKREGYTSRHHGCMHACGHDGHMAIMLAFAEYVSERDLPNNILIIFQPAEETTGGAKRIVETGILEEYKVGAVFGLHLWPNLEAGVLSSKGGAMMPKSSEITVRVKGKSVHAAKAHEGTDALLIGARLLEEIYALRDKVLEKEMVLLQICTFVSGNSTNVVPGEALLRGTMRVFSLETFKALKEGILKKGTEIEKEYGCKIEVDFSEGYLPVINDQKLYQAAKYAFNKAGNYEELSAPVMIAEDFSYYGAARPALFAFLGTGKKEPLHSADFNFQEETLLTGLNYFKALSSLSMASFKTSSEQQ